MKLSYIAQAFHCYDFTGSRALGRHHARHNGHTVQKNGAGATFALGAAFFDASKPGSAQAIKQGHTAG
jgi:hypothetical protein